MMQTLAADGIVFPKTFSSVCSWSLRDNRGYCRQITTQAWLEEIGRLFEAPSTAGR